MKFRTSFCNGPVLRKDLTRFAPLWGCYSIFLLLMLTVLASLVIIWGAVVDITEALRTRRLVQQLDDMDDTISAMATLNTTLRTQRHDFLNHLQVVYSLMEMDEYKEACQYIEQVYGDIRAVSSSLKTATSARTSTMPCRGRSSRRSRSSAGCRKKQHPPAWRLPK